jgi:hypothetical protein
VLLVGVGALLVVSVVVLLVTTRGVTHVNATTFRSVMPLIAGLALPGAVLLAAWRAIVQVEETWRTWAIVIGVGLALRLAWLGQVPPLDDDFFRYLWDGALVAHGHDPYARAPQAFLTGSGMPASLAPLAARALVILESINFNDMRTIYPSVAQAAFALGHLIAPFKLDGLRVVFLAGEMATLFLLVQLLKATGRPAMWATLYWWNPLAAAMAVGFAHVDALVAPLVLGALLLQVRGRPIAALSLIGLGAGVKVWPVMLAPIVLWPMIREPRRLIVACLVLGVTLAGAVGPVILSSLTPGSGFTAYAAGWANNNAFYAWAVHGLRIGLGFGDGAERALRLSLALATGLLALAQAFRGDASAGSLAQRYLIVAAGVFYLSPAQFPWYAIWFLPLAALKGNLPLLLASVLLPCYFLFFPQWPVENGSLFFYALAFIHSVPVLGWLLLDAMRESWRSGRPSVAGS